MLSMRKTWGYDEEIHGDVDLFSVCSKPTRNLFSLSLSFSLDQATWKSPGKEREKKRKEDFGSGEGGEKKRQSESLLFISPCLLT